MLNEDEKRSRAQRWRLRLKAGALALVFSVFSLLPWFHVMTAGTGHSGHGCCRQVTAESPARGVPAPALQDADASDSCWVCRGLISLLQHNERTGAAAFAVLSPASAYIPRAPHAPALVQIFPASRAQAPPARA
ncbi:MAG: hypothetical protein PHV28_06855 [Kiritimatiellae bacterium]|nr:hypothetical protein [Kiritimatiellia bacterium]